MKEVKFDINGREYTVEIHAFGAYEAELTVNGRSYTIGLKDLGLESPSEIQPQPSPVTPTAPPPAREAVFFSETHVANPKAAGPVLKKPESVVHARNITAPLPGQILKILVQVGDRVQPGQDVAVMEAMKMENEIQAHAAGEIKEIRVRVGDNVSEGDVLFVIG